MSGTYRASSARQGKGADKQTPWTGWTRHGAIMLSGGRGPDRELGDIRVFERLPRSIFTEFEAIRLPEESR